MTGYSLLRRIWESLLCITPTAEMIASLLLQLKIFISFSVYTYQV